MSAFPMLSMYHLIFKSNLMLHDRLIVEKRRDVLKYLTSYEGNRLPEIESGQKGQYLKATIYVHQ